MGGWGWRREEGLESLGATIELHGSHPDLFAIAFLCESMVDLPFMYIADIEDGARRMIRALPDLAQR